MILSLSLFTAFVSIALSLISSPSYLGLVSLALLFAVAHLGCTIVFLLRTRFRAKWLLLLVSLPVLVFSLDNLGRLLHTLGIPGFRISI